MMPASKTPPRYVPTLTEVVTSAPVADNQPAPLTPTMGTGNPRDVAALQEQLVHRVMQRVDMSMELRLRNAVATLVLEQTRDLGPLLRKEIETVVRTSVADALADELAQIVTPKAPAGPPY